MWGVSPLPLSYPLCSILVFVDDDGGGGNYHRYYL